MGCIEAVVATIVGEIAKYTFVPIGRQFGYLYHYQRNIKNLSNQIQNLQKKKASIDDEVREARTKGKEPTKEVEDWFAEVAGQCEAGNEFLGSEDHAKAKCGLFPNLWLRRKLSREAQKMAQTVASVTEKASNLRNNISKIPSLRCSFNNKNFEDFNSRKQTLEEIMEALKDRAYRMIGVYGAGGIGKTTLVTEAANMAKKEGLFRKVAIVTLSQTFEVGVKLKEIAENLDLEMPEETESARAQRLKDGLRKQENILIVLDDIWETKVPDLSKDFGIDFKNEQSDCKIVLVSRDQSVLQNLMGVDKNIMLHFLTDHEAMNLFKKFVGGTIHPDFKSCAISLVEECGGLPIAIVTIACTLKKKRDIRVWKNTLRELKSSPREGYGKAYSSIKTSYDSLESDQAKMVLLLCSLHEEDANIRVENLMSIHGAVCNSFHNMDTLEEARDSMHVLVERLKERCLLLNGDIPDTVKMHDVIRDIMGSIAQDDKGMHCFPDFSKFEGFLKHGELKESHAISVLKCDTDRFPEELACHKLELLLLAPEYSLYTENRQSILVPDDWFKAAKELKALWLGSLILEPLPPSIWFLQNLQTLSFQNCKLDDIALIGELKNLIVLDLSCSDFKLLPEEIGKLNRLRQLNLNRCSRIAVISPNVISSLVELEELYMDSVDINWGRQVRVDGDLRINASLTELKNLKQLGDLHLYIKDPTVIPNDGFVRECLEKYRIIVGKDPETWYGSNFSSLSSLIVHGCGSLKQLVPSGICGSLMQLERLEISDCPMIEEFVAINEQEGGERSTQNLLPKLKYLKLENLASLKRFFSGDCMMECESLLKLKIDNCPQLITNSLHTSRRVDEEAQQPLLNDKVMLPSILKQLLQFSDQTSFRNLQNLEIGECHTLQCLFPYSNVESLAQLKRLSIWNCEVMKVVVTTTKALGEDQQGLRPNHDHHIFFPKLESITLRDLPKLKSFCEGDRIECPSLLRLKISDCESLRTFVADSADIQPVVEQEVGGIELQVTQQPLFNHVVAFPLLQDLSVSECKSLKYLLSCSAATRLSELMRLELESCDGIEEIIFVTENTTISFPKLQSVELSRLRNLKRMSSSNSCIVEYPCLEELTIKASLPDAQPQANETVMLPSILKQLLQFSDQTSFRNLKKLEIGECHTLQCLFPYSTVESLAQLKELSIWDCEVMEVVVTTTKAIGEDQQGLRLNHDHHIFFPKLESIILGNLPKLKSFCEGDRIECPSLLRLYIGNCESLRTFVADSAHIQPVVEQEVGGIDLQVTQQPIFNQMVAFPLLQYLSVSKCKSLKYLLSCSAATRLSELMRLELYGCDRIEEIIFVTENTTISLPKLQSVELRLLGNLTRISSSNSCIIECPCLARLTIWECRGLGTSDIDSSRFTLIREEKHQVGEKASIADTQPPANEKVMLPSTLKQLLQFSDQISFRNLQELEIDGCHTLQCLFPYSTVESLAQLKQLEIWDCEALEVVVTTTKVLGEDQQGLRLNDHHIFFPKLESLSLRDLPKLKLFCEGDRIECPSLLVLEISHCESLRTFVADSAHIQLVVEQEVGGIDLQVTQQPLFNHMVAFSNLEQLTLNGKGANAIWRRQSSSVLPFPKLKVIQSRCYVRYDQTSFVPFDIHIHQNIKEISLTNILVEKMIWQHQEENDHQIPQTFQNLETLTVKQFVSFTNLTSLEVSECHEMVNLFTASTAKTLVLLKKMSIYDCKRMTEVVIGNKKGEAAESSSGIVFSQLETLALHGLPSLKCFHGGNTNIQFPLLNKVIVSECPEMEIFSNGSTTTPKLNEVITKAEFNYLFSRDPERATAIEEIWAGDLNGTVREIWEISFGIALQRLFSETEIYESYTDSEEYSEYSLSDYE